MSTTNIAVFASGNGTNAENLIKHFSENKTIRITLVISNKVDAGIHERVKKYGVESLTFNKAFFFDGRELIMLLDDKQIEYIILAGFLLKLPENLVTRFKKRILNIHPSLLPNFGGLGMYGMNVHKAVIDSGVSESGITIHLVDGDYDTGVILFQKGCKIEDNDTPESLAIKIHNLEYEYFPEVVENFISNNKTSI